MWNGPSADATVDDDVSENAFAIGWEAGKVDAREEEGGKYDDETICPKRGHDRESSQLSRVGLFVVQN